MRLGEGSGAVTALPVLRTAQALLAGMGTLADIGVPTGAASGRSEARPAVEQPRSATGIDGDP